MLNVMLSQAQQTDFIQIKDPIVDTTLTLSSTWFDMPHYIVNSNYVVFQGNDNNRIENYGDRNSRKILNVDINSFRTSPHSIVAFDKNGVYFNGIFIKTDTTGFKIVGSIDESTRYIRKTNYIWKTKNKVFLNTTEITGDIDVPSFQYISTGNSSYFKDKNYIYYNGQKIEGSEGSSASKSFNSFVVYDKNYVYMDGKIAMYNGYTIRPVNDFLAKTEKDVLMYSYKGHIVQPDMDTKTIKPLSKYYSMDKNFVYFENEKIPILPENFDHIKVWSHCISVGTNVYWGRNILQFQSNLDVKTFGMIPSTSIFFDKNGIYRSKWDDEKKESIFVKLPFSYTKEVTEKNTFISRYFLISRNFLIYENQAYDLNDLYEEKIYKNLTQEQIDLAKDNKLDITLINGKTTQKTTFLTALLNKQLYEADNKIYYDGEETIADAQTFQQIPGTIFFKDRRNVYMHDRDKGLIPVQGIDMQTAISVQTITTNKYNFLADKDYIYANNFRVIKNNDVELLAIFGGSRPDRDGRGHSSDYYLFKNSEGYWLVLIYKSSGVRVKYLGNKLNESIQKLLSEE